MTERIIRERSPILLRANSNNEDSRHTKAPAKIVATKLIYLMFGYPGMLKKIAAEDRFLFGLTNVAG